MPQLYIYVCYIYVTQSAFSPVMCYSASRLRIYTSVMWWNKVIFNVRQQYLLFTILVNVRNVGLCFVFKHFAFQMHIYMHQICQALQNGLTQLNMCAKSYISCIPAMFCSHEYYYPKHILWDLTPFSDIYAQIYGIYLLNICI